jgi:hypothetical protein
MDIETIVYIAIFILFSIFSGNKANKKKRSQPEEEYDEPDTSLEDEIRRMAERMTGKRTQEKQPEPEYRAEEKKKEYTSPYKTYDRKTNYDRDVEPIERIPTEPVKDYSVSDVESLREYNERIRNQKYEPEVTNLEARSIDSLARGMELHSVMDDKEEENKSLMEIIDERFDYSNFDPRKAVIFTEILKRPEY